MGCEKIYCDLGFADLALASSLRHNRSLKFMVKLKNTIDWTRVNEILMAHDTVGSSGEGAGAWPFLLLFKCMMLQKWFRPSTIFRTYWAGIQSDPEL